MLRDPQDDPIEIDFTATVTLVCRVYGVRPGNMDVDALRETLRLLTMTVDADSDSALGSMDVHVEEQEVDCD